MMIVKGVRYATNPQSDMQLSSLRAMRREFGVGWGDVQARVIESAAANERITNLLSEDLFLAWMFAWMVNAGDDITRADVDALTVGDIDFPGPDSTPDAGGAVEQVPTSAPTGSGRGDDSPGAPPDGQPTPASTTTSSEPSSSASS